MHKNARAIAALIGMTSLVVGFALLKPGLGFIAAGILILTPVFLRK